MSKGALGKATIGDIVIDHRAVNDEDCDINVYKVNKDPENGPSGNGDSIWGYDPKCDCDLTSETSPAGQEGFLEAKCNQLKLIKGMAGTQNDSQTTSEMMLASNYQHEMDYQQAGMGAMAKGGVFLALAFGLIYATANLDKVKKLHTKISNGLTNLVNTYSQK